jgi:DNA-binding transcriptional LysR family regulator
VQALLRGDCHFMLCHTHSHVDIQLPEDHFVSVKVGEDRLLPLSAPDDTGKPSQRLPGTTDNPLSYLTYSDTSAIGRAVDYILSNRSEKACLNRVFESHLAGVLKTMSREGRGLAWLPESQAQDDLDTGALVLSGDESWSFPVDIRLFRSRDPLPQASEEFWKQIDDAEQASR